MLTELLPERMASGEPVTPAPRVLLVTEAAGGGVGRHFLDLAEGLAARGIQVQGVYSPGRIDALFQERLAGGGLPPLVSLPMRRAISPADAVAVRRLVQLARKLGPFDLIHGHSSKGGAIARLASRWLGIPSIYTPHALVTLDPTLSAWKRFAYGNIESWLAKSTAAIIAVSEDEAGHARSLGIHPAKLQVIPNGIDPPKLLPRDQARFQMGLSKDAIAIGFVGRLSSQKAPDNLLQAFAAFAPAHPQVHLAIVGSGGLEPALRQLANERRIAHQVHFLGDQVAQPLMAGFDIFCLPSRYEGMPYVLLEALAAGLPIVVTDVGGARLAVEHEINGVIVPCSNVVELAQALQRLAQDSPLRQRFARAASARAEQFTRQRMVDQTLALYRRILQLQAQSNRFSHGRN